jgi:Protein of unknown function (DUF1559)
MKISPSRIAGFVLAAVLPAVLWAMLTPGINAGEPIGSDARTMAGFRFLLAFAFGFFFMYEYSYMMKAYRVRANPQPDQLMNRLDLLKQRDRMTSFRWIALGLLSLCTFALFEYKPEQNSNWSKGCQRNVSKLSTALMSYYKDKGCYPPAYVADSAGKPMHSWRVLILPYLGEEELYREYSFSEPWDGPHNSRLAAKVPDVFLCPVRNARYTSLLRQWIGGAAMSSQSSFAILSGPGTAFQKDKSPKSADFPDGADRTLLLVERATARGNWLKPADMTCAEFSRIPASSLTMHSARSDGFHVCFANGAIDVMSSTVSPKQRTELAQAADGLPRKTVVSN